MALMAAFCWAIIDTFTGLNSLKGLVINYGEGGGGGLQNRRWVGGR